MKFRDALGNSLTRMIITLEQKFTSRIIFSQPSCIGKRDLAEGKDQADSMSKRNILQKVSRFTARIINQFGLISLEQELDSSIKKKTEAVFSKILQKVSLLTVY